MVAHAWLALGLEALGRRDEAVTCAEETARLSGGGVSSSGSGTPTL